MAHAAQHQAPAAAPAAQVAIHPDGLYRWGQFAALVPFSRETWRHRILQGRAPRPVSQSPNCTAYRGADILAWLADPDGYQAVSKN
ncbi:helix-turn-helix transcriptional regulator [Achromobacter insolitus]|uniref:helix-turn-helix transcriptional regulator n=1 Tax=Achromobacter insolitus TaxID=217204 RepID=UPI000B15C9DA|nr:transcriptional regulator [Achromobacter insolitus]